MTPQITYIALGIAALALSIYGYKTMVGGTQKMFGQWVRRKLSESNLSGFSYILRGVAAAGLLQSSSTISHITVSSVNVGVSRLSHAIRIIFGANVGTTSFSWIVFIVGFAIPWSLNVASVLLIIGLPLIYASKSRLKIAGELIVGFSILFLGLNILLLAFENITFFQNGVFQHSLSGLEEHWTLAIMGFFIVGGLLTMATQSSAAAMVVILALVQTGLPLYLGMAMILGENIGTTISTNLVAASGNAYAKRAARAHLIFNVIGLIWVIVLFSPTGKVLQSIQYQAPSGVLGVQGALCVFHTGFNLITATLLGFLVRPMMNLVRILVPSRTDEDRAFRLEFMKSGVSTGELSLFEAKAEVVRFGKVTQRMSELIFDLMTSTDSRKQSTVLREIEELEMLTDQMEVSIGNYLSEISISDLSEKGSANVQSMFSVINDLERIADIFFQISKIYGRKIETRIYFLPKQRQRLLSIYQLVNNAVEVMNKNLEAEESGIDFQLARNSEIEINALRDSIKKIHLRDVEKGKYNIQSGMIYNDIFSAFERIGDHIINVTEGLALEKPI